MFPVFWHAIPQITKFQRDEGISIFKVPNGYLIEVLPQWEMIVEVVDCLGLESHCGEIFKDDSKCNV